MCLDLTCGGVGATLDDAAQHVDCAHHRVAQGVARAADGVVTVVMATDDHSTTADASVTLSVEVVQCVRVHD